MRVDTTSDGEERVDDNPDEQALRVAMAEGELVLANRFGAAITLSEPEDLAGSGPAVVVRATVASSPYSLPHTLVIKHYAAPPRQPPDPFATEAVSYQLFTALTSEERMCPELIGHDVERRVLVLTDLGRAPTLRDTLHMTDSRAAERTLLSWARALGRMHATTAAREADFNALLRRFGSRPTCLDERTVEACDRVPSMLRELFDVESSTAVREQVRAAVAAVHGGNYRAFSPVDLSPENNLVTPNGVRFLDFEHGCVRNAVIDVAHLRVPFAFWDGALALPAGMSDAMIAVWRAEVVDIWPALGDDDVFAAALLDSQVLCVWSQSAKELPELVSASSSAQPGRPAALEHWWQDLATQAARLGRSELAEHARAVAGALEARFGPELELPMYPAFR